jgi:hypothetical protein
MHYPDAARTLVFGMRHPDDRAYSPARRGIWRGMSLHQPA